VSPAGGAHELRERRAVGHLLVVGLLDDDDARPGRGQRLHRRDAGRGPVAVVERRRARHAAALAHGPAPAGGAGSLSLEGILQLHRELEVPQHVPHGRALDALLAEALLGRVGELLEALRRDLVLDRRVDDVQQRAVPLAQERVVGEADLLPRQRRVEGRPREEHLEEHDAEGVHVGLVGELLPPEVLRVEVPEAALHHGAHVRLVHRGRPGLGEAEVGDLGDPVLVEEDVGGLDVAVDDGVLGAGVEVVQAPCGADTDVEAEPPRQRRLAAHVEVLPQRAVLHVVVDEDHLAGVLAEADEGDEVPVPQLGQHLHLRLELLHALLRRRVRPLDGHLGVAVHDAPVHLAEPAHADHQRLAEVLGGHLDLGEREVPAHPRQVRREVARRLAAGVGVVQRQPPGGVRPAGGLQLLLALFLVPHHADGGDDPERRRAARHAAHHRGDVAVPVDLGRQVVARAQLRLGEQPGGVGIRRGQVAGGVVDLEDLEAVEDGVVELRAERHGRVQRHPHGLVPGLVGHVHREVLVHGHALLRRHPDDVGVGLRRLVVDVDVEGALVGAVEQQFAEVEARDVGEVAVHRHDPGEVVVLVEARVGAHGAAAQVHIRRRSVLGEVAGVLELEVRAGLVDDALRRAQHVRRVVVPVPGEAGVVGRRDVQAADVEAVHGLERRAGDVHGLVREPDHGGRVREDVGHGDHLDAVHEGVGLVARRRREGDGQEPRRRRRQRELPDHERLAQRLGVVVHAEVVEQRDARGRDHVEVEDLRREPVVGGRVEVEAHPVAVPRVHGDVVRGLRREHPRRHVGDGGRQPVVHHVGRHHQGRLAGVGQPHGVVRVRHPPPAVRVQGVRRRPAVEQDPVRRGVQLGLRDGGDEKQHQQWAPSCASHAPREDGDAEGGVGAWQSGGQWGR
jgi:hypothetical protein